jgi:hypothetical protein
MISDLHNPDKTKYEIKHNGVLAFTDDLGCRYTSILPVLGYSRIYRTQSFTSTRPKTYKAETLLTNGRTIH